MEKRAEELLVRAVVALENLATEPELEIPSSPPLCPHCGIHNPVVTSQEVGGTGPMSDMFLDLKCSQCDHEFFVVPQGWVNFSNKAELREFFERAENEYSAEAN